MTLSIRQKALIAAIATIGLGLVQTPAAFAQSSQSASETSTMPGMDHAPMPGSDRSPVPTMGLRAPAESRTPIPALTDADRQAAFLDSDGHTVHDKTISSFFLVDQLEWQDGREGGSLNWDVKGWIGGDIDRLWIRSEGERSNGKLGESEIQALWGHAVSPWWDVVGGIRHDFKPGSSQNWAAFGIQGLALYNFEAEATAFVGENGQTAARLKGEYDILITNRLILQPTAEINFHGKNDRGRSVGSGLSNTEVGLRLRYEIRREFAPYIGVTWNRAYGNTADYARADGEARNEARFLVGVRMWF